MLMISKCKESFTVCADSMVAAQSNAKSNSFVFIGLSLAEVYVVPVAGCGTFLVNAEFIEILP